MTCEVVFEGKPRDMSRPGCNELNFARMSHRIEALEQDIRALGRRNDVLKQIINDICNITGLEPPDLRYQRYVPLSRSRKDDLRDREALSPQAHVVAELRYELLAELMILRGIIDGTVRKQRCFTLQSTC